MYVRRMYSSHPRLTIRYTTYTRQGVGAQSASSASGGPLRRSSPRLGVFGGSKAEGPGALDEARGCAGLPLPVCLWRCRSLVEPSFGLASIGLANFPWTPPMRRNRAAIALGDKSNLRKPSFGDRPSPSKRNGTAAEQNREAKEERSSGPPAWHRPRKASHHLPNLACACRVSNQPPALVPNPPLSAR